MIFFNSNTAVALNNISKSKVPIVPNLDPSIRAKRLMKEFRELQKIQLEKIFTVRKNQTSQQQL
jgi:hypothetical protein